MNNNQSTINQNRNFTRIMYKKDGKIYTFDPRRIEIKVLIQNQNLNPTPVLMNQREMRAEHKEDSSMK